MISGIKLKTRAKRGEIEQCVWAGALQAAERKYWEPPWQWEGSLVGRDVGGVCGKVKGKRRVWMENAEDDGKAATGTKVNGGARGDQVRPLDALQLQCDFQAGVENEKGRADINEGGGCMTRQFGADVDHIWGHCRESAMGGSYGRARQMGKWATRKSRSHGRGEERGDS